MNHRDVQRHCCHFYTRTSLSLHSVRPWIEVGLENQHILNTLINGTAPPSPLPTPSCYILPSFHFHLNRRSDCKNSLWLIITSYPYISRWLLQIMIDTYISPKFSQKYQFNFHPRSSYIRVGHWNAHQMCNNHWLCWG